MQVDSAAKSRNEPQRVQRTHRFPLYFFVFFAVKKLFAVEASLRRAKIKLCIKR
jgi:hypothetical protein